MKLSGVYIIFWEYTIKLSVKSHTRSQKFIRINIDLQREILWSSIQLFQLNLKEMGGD